MSRIDQEIKAELDEMFQEMRDPEKQDERAQKDQEKRSREHVINRLGL